MAALTFDDLDSEAPAAKPSRALTFDDLTPLDTASMLGQEPGAFLPTSQEQASRFGHDLLSATDRAGANIPFADRISAGLEAATGIGGKFGDYTGNLAAERARTAKAAEENPGIEAGAGVVGSSLFPVPAVGWMAKGAGLADKAARGGLAGGIFGLLQGASSTPDLTKPDPKHLLASTLIGAGVGEALPALGHMAGSAYNWAASKATPAVAGMSKQAQQYLLDKLLSGSQAPEGELARLGPPAMVADINPALGGGAVALAKGAASPEAKNYVTDALTQRNEGTYGRLREGKDSNLGAFRNPDQITADMQAARARIGSEIPNVLANAGPVDTSNVLSTLGNSLTQASGDVDKTALLNKVRKRLVQPVMNSLGEPIEGMVAPVTDALTLHNTKEQLDRWVKRGIPSLDIAPGALSEAQGPVAYVRGQLNQALRKDVPGYADINDRLSSLHRQEEQIDLGKTQVLAGGPNATHPESHAATFGALPVPEQEAQRAGTAGSIEQALGTQANDLQALRGLLQGEGGWNTQKLGNQFGEQPVHNLVSQVEAEQQFRDLYSNAIKNSVTTPSAEAIKDMGRYTSPATAPFFPNSLRNVTAVGGGLEAARKVANHLASAFRTPVDPGVVESQIARGLMQQGPHAQELVNQLMGRNASQLQNAANAERIRRATMMGGALGANAALSDRR